VGRPWLALHLCPAVARQSPKTRNTRLHRRLLPYAVQRSPPASRQPSHALGPTVPKPPRTSPPVSGGGTAEHTSACPGSPPRNRRQSWTFCPKFREPLP